MLSSVLKENTLASHQSLEKALLVRLKNIKSEKDYASVLAIFYGFMSPLEHEIAKTEVDMLLPDYFSRRKANWIENDLKLLSVNVSEIRLCRNLPPVEDAIQALGALYVMEGSTLGGQVITKMIADRLPKLSLQALSFFSGYKEDTIMMWDRFKQVLNAVPHNAEGIEVSAIETFTAFRNWIIENEQKKL